MIRKMASIREPARVSHQLPDEPEFYAPQINHREDYATEALIALAEDHQDQPQFKNKQQNTFEITSWNNNYLNVLKAETQQNRRRRKFRVKHERSSLRDQNLLQNSNMQWNFGVPLKKELNKLRLPLREKTFNSQQITALSTQKDRERSKTRKQLKLQIMSNKQELTPMLKAKRKIKVEWKCYNIIRESSEGHKYRKIHRKDFYTIQNEDEGVTLTRTHSKNQTTSRFQSPKLIQLRGGSIQRLTLD